MTEGPKSAFALSLAGGAATLAISLLEIRNWLFVSSRYSTYGNTTWSFFPAFGDFTAAQAVVLMAIGAACGVSTIVGAALQRSGKPSTVRAGSVLVLAATIVGAVPTTFGYLIGGVLCVSGAAVGLSWKPGRDGSL